jgi:hypothetical protein
MRRDPSVGSPSGPVALATACCLLAGVWLSFAPHVLDYMFAATIWTDTALGVVVAAASAVAIAAREPIVWPAAIAVVFGIWLVVSALTFGLADAAVENRVATGTAFTVTGVIRLFP